MYTALILLLLFLASSALAETLPQENQVPPGNSFWLLKAPKEWPAQVMPGIRGGSEKSLYYVDNLIPLAGTKDAFIFIDDKTVMGSGGQNEENVGLGARSLLFDEKLILGTNFFYDTRYTLNKVRHHQLAFGLEGMSKWVDVRGNFYFPISGKQILSDDTTFAFRSRSLNELDTYEEPLTGLDYEVGALIPYVSEYVETRAFLGGYNYFPSYDKGLNGIKARFEVRPIKSFTIDVEIKKDNYNPAECFVEAFMSIPLDTMNVFRIKNPFTEFTRYFSYKKGIRPLRQRMVDRVVRDIDVTTKRTPIQETKAHDLTYVDNSYTGGNSDGTLSHPYTTVQNGVNNAVGDKWVYVREGLSQSAAHRYASDITLANGTVLWGSGYDGGFRGLGVSGIYPVINGGTNGVVLNNNNTVMGMQIQNATNDGIIFTNGTTLTGTIKYNSITGNGNDGIDLFGNTGTMTNFIISNNMVNNSIGNDGIDLESNYGTMSNFTISSNTIKSNGILGGNGEGIGIDANYGKISGFIISNNTSNDNGHNNSSSDGIESAFNSGTISDFIISNNISNNNPRNGINLSANSGTISDFTFSHNTVIGNYQDGIIFSNSGAGAMINMNLGNGMTGGFNSIYGNYTSGGLHYDINNGSGINSLPAEYNWWGQAGGPIAGQIGGANTVDSSNPLSSNPN